MTKKCANKSGFTLIELMVYIAILGIVVLVAGQAFSDSTKFRVRTQNMLKAGEAAQNAGLLLQEDIAQMGAKTDYQQQFRVSSDVYIDAENTNETERDSSSYDLQLNSEGNSVLTLRAIRYNNEGTNTAVEEVKWAVTNRNLYRFCRNITGTPQEGCSKDGDSVLVTADIDTFRVYPGLDTVVRLFPNQDTSKNEFSFVSRKAGESSSEGNFVPVTIRPSGENAEIKNYTEILGFFPNYNFGTNTPDLSYKRVSQIFALDKIDSSAWGTIASDSKLSLKPKTEYRVRFSMTKQDDPGRSLVPAQDHLAVGIRKLNGDTIGSVNDFLFYPPVEAGASEQERVMRFTVPQAMEALLAFTFVIYSPVGGAATLRINDLVVEQVGENYVFKGEGSNNSINTDKKKNVKAFKVKIVVQKNKETGNSEIVVPVPSNGTRG